MRRATDIAHIRPCDASSLDILVRVAVNILACLTLTPDLTV